ncbi:MAG: hypothetical protein JWP74_1417 [Marmoricola sp.]|nr:hypothetical protein [Marmoricola sp.]
MADHTPSSFRQALRTLCAALMASLVIILVAIVSILASDGTGTPPVWAIAVLVAAAVAEVAVIPVIGYRFVPVVPGTAEDEARRTSASQLQSTTILRFALAEAIALVSIALALTVDAGGIYLAIVGVAVAEVLMFLHVWPNERLISRAQEVLESEGGRSYLREALDSPPPSRSQA